MAKTVYKLPILNKGGIISTDNSIVTKESYKSAIDQINEILRSGISINVANSYKNEEYMKCELKQKSKSSDDVNHIRTHLFIQTAYVGKIDSIDYDFIYIEAYDEFIPFFESMINDSSNKSIFGVSCNYIILDIEYPGLWGLLLSPSIKTIHSITKFDIMHIPDNIIQSTNALYGANYPDCLKKQDW